MVTFKTPPPLGGSKYGKKQGLYQDSRIRYKTILFKILLLVKTLHFLGEGGIKKTSLSANTLRGNGRRRQNGWIDGAVFHLLVHYLLLFTMLFDTSKYCSLQRSFVTLLDNTCQERGKQTRLLPGLSRYRNT